MGLLATFLLGAALGKPLVTGPHAYASGVTGGNAYCGTPTLVANLNTSGAGSLWDAIEGNKSNRCIHFTVSGYIDVTIGQTIRTLGDNVTVDCRTAPRPGIAIRGLVAIGDGHPESNLQSDNWIWQHCRFTRGGGAPGSPFVASNVDGLYLNHPTFAYGADEGGSLFAIYAGNRVRNVHMTAPLFTHQLGCSDSGLDCYQAGHAVPHNYSSLIGGTIENVSIWRGFFGYADWRNPSVIIGQNPVDEGPATGMAYIEKIQSWHHKTGKSNTLAEENWHVYYDVIDNVYTASKLDRPEDIGSMTCNPPTCEQKFYMLRNREGATIGTLSAPTDAQSNIFSAIGEDISIRPQYVAAARQGTHHALPRGDSTQTISLVSAGAGATIPCRSPFEERALLDALNDRGRDIVDDENDLGGWPNLADSESCSGFTNKPVVGVAETASGATNTTINWQADCSDPDSKPFDRYYWVTTSPSAGVAAINLATGAGTFDATGVTPGEYPFTVTCSDGYSQDTDTVTITVTS